MRGFFTINGQRIPNFITEEGEEIFVKMMARDDQSIIAGGANFYLGLTTEINISKTAGLVDLTGELTSQGGYARKAIARSSVGWPTVGKINGVYRAKTAAINFAAAGADYSDAFTRAFLCTVAAGSVGFLISFSGRLATPLLITDGNNEDIFYELFAR